MVATACSNGKQSNWLSLHPVYYRGFKIKRRKADIQKQEIMLKKWQHFTTVVVLCVLVGNDPGRESLSFSFFPIVGYLALKRKMPICGGNPGMASWCECSCS